MSPVHVIVGEDPRAEAMWASAFTGAVDIYSFPRNVDAFERLTAAQAPVDLLVLTPAQSGPFNLTPDQLVARVLEGPLAAGGYLANLHVIVVGEPLMRSHPRAMAVSTLDAAIRLVKFGEVERAPRPRAPRGPVASPATPAAPARTSSSVRSGGLDDLPFAGSVISRIWDAGDEAASVRGSDDLRAVQAAPAAPVLPAAAAPRPTSPSEPVSEESPVDEVIGGGAAAHPAGVPLFSRAAPKGFVVGGGAAVGSGGDMAPAPGAVPAHAAPIGAPHEAIQVATGVHGGLQSARPYVLPSGGEYRGPAVRGGVVNAASHDAMGGQPVPPALASQVEAMVYGGSVQVGNPHDPIMIWSSAARAAAQPAPAPGAPVAVPVAVIPGAHAHAHAQVQGVGAHPQMHAQVTMPVHSQVAQQPQHVVRTVPMEPPAGAYGVAAVPSPHVGVAVDPFVARAEAAGAAASFG